MKTPRHCYALNFHFGVFVFTLSITKKVDAGNIYMLRLGWMSKVYGSATG